MSGNLTPDALGLQEPAYHVGRVDLSQNESDGPVNLTSAVAGDTLNHIADFQLSSEHPGNNLEVNPAVVKEAVAALDEDACATKSTGTGPKTSPRSRDPRRRTS